MKNFILNTDVDYTLTAVSSNADCLDDDLQGQPGTTGIPLDAMGFGLAAIRCYQAVSVDALGMKLMLELFRKGTTLTGYSYEAAAEELVKQLPEICPSLDVTQISRDLVKHHFDTVMVQYIPETSRVRMPVARLVQRVRAAQIPICAVSNSGRAIVEANLALVDTKLGEKLLWQNTVTADEVRHSKPAPDMYEKSFYDAVDKNGWSARDTYVFVIEDNKKGVDSADAARKCIKEKTGVNNFFICGVPLNYIEAQKMAGLCNVMVSDKPDMFSHLTIAFRQFSGLSL